MDIRDVARDIARECATDPAMAFRVLIHGVTSLEPEDLRPEPASTGSRRWDALLAGSVRYQLHRRGHTPPPWTCAEPLGKFWFPIRVNASQEYAAMAHSPIELSRLGIFVDDRAFETA